MEAFQWFATMSSSTGQCPGCTQVFTGYILPPKLQIIRKACGRVLRVEEFHKSLRACSLPSSLVHPSSASGQTPGSRSPRCRRGLPAWSSARCPPPRSALQSWACTRGTLLWRSFHHRPCQKPWCEEGFSEKEEVIRRLHLNAILISSIVSVLPTWFLAWSILSKEVHLLVHHQDELAEVHLPVVVDINFCHNCVHLVRIHLDIKWWWRFFSSHFLVLPKKFTNNKLKTTF